MQNMELAFLMRGFYREQLWERIYGDGIASQMTTEPFVDFAVNAGVGVARKPKNVGQARIPYAYRKLTSAGAPA